MANTFSLASQAYSGRYLQLECSQSKDIASNKSTISWKLSSIGGSSNYYSVGPTTVVINGTTVYSKARVNWDARVFPAARGSVSGTILVDHNSDGSKSINVSLSTAIYSGQVSSSDGAWVLDSIPRFARITAAPAFTDVDNPTISFNNPGGFPMDVWLEPNPIGDHLCIREKIPNTGAYTWSLDELERHALRNKCTGKSSCVIRVGLYSYIDGVQYADYRDVIYTMTEHARTKPMVMLAVVPAIISSGTNLPADLKRACVQGKSRLAISVVATGLYGATIDSITTTVDGKAYSGASFTVPSIGKSGAIDIISSVRDSRGFTNTASEQINVIPYTSPQITSFSVERQADETTVVARLIGSVSPVENKNTKAFRITLGGVTKTLSAADYAIDEAVTFTDVPAETTTTAVAEIADAFSTITKEAVVPTAAVTLDFHHSGSGIAMGKVAEHEDMLDVAWDIRMKGSLVVAMTDFPNQLAETGYQKLPGGLMIQWGTSVVGTEDTTINFPAEFSEACYVVVGNPKQYGKQSITFWGFTTTSFTMSSGGIRMNVLWIALGK